MLGNLETPSPPSPRLAASPPQKTGKPRSLSVAEFGMALPHAPNVAALGIDFTDEFAHLGLMTEFAGRVGEALGLVINRSSDRRLDVSRTIPSVQSLAVEPSAAAEPGGRMPHHERGSWLAGQPFRTVQLTRPRQGLVKSIPSIVRPQTGPCSLYRSQTPRGIVLS